MQVKECSGQGANSEVIPVAKADESDKDTLTFHVIQESQSDMRRKAWLPTQSVSSLNVRLLHNDQVGFRGTRVMLSPRVGSRCGACPVDSSTG